MHRPSSLLRARRALLTTVPVTALATGLAGCAGGAVGNSGADEQNVAVDVGEVTVVSDESADSVEPLCVDDIPEDYTACAGAPQNLGEVELAETLKLTVEVPENVAESGYQLRLNGIPLGGAEEIKGDLSEAVRVPAEIVAEPGPTVLTVEALTGILHPKAVWEFLLSDPEGVAEDGVDAS